MSTNVRPAITERVMLNGKFLIGGTEGTGRIIFKNLSGENFQPGRPAFFQTHGQYLAQMQHELGCEFAEGDVITLHIAGQDQQETTLTAEHISGINSGAQAVCGGAQ